MPKIERSICRNSARAGGTPIRIANVNNAKTFRISLSPFLKKPCKVECHSHPFPPLRGGGVAVRRVLHADGNRVVLVDPQRRRPHEHLMGRTAGNTQTLAGEFAENPPVPALVFTPRGRTVCV